MSVADRVMAAIAADQMSTASDLQRATGLNTVTMTMVLDRLEREGKIVGEFLDGPYPRRRIYYFPPG